jgi:hypothetical protein
MDPGPELASSTAYGSITGNLDPNPRIKSPLLCSRIPRYYLHLHVRTSEDMSLTCRKLYRIMTAAATRYRDIRANMEQTRNPHGLDHYGNVVTLSG